MLNNFRKSGRPTRSPLQYSMLDTGIIPDHMIGLAGWYATKIIARMEKNPDHYQKFMEILDFKDWA